VGDLAAVEVIMPVGSDPHDFSPSARQAESMENADLLVVNGAGFEEGMIGIIEQVESTGTRVFEFADHIELLEFDGDHGLRRRPFRRRHPTTTTPTTTTPTTTIPTTTRRRDHDHWRRPAHLDRPCAHDHRCGGVR
jgi:ABC-type Zn uptake system ZnuABC Zn-binding protein ZnuA